MDGRKSEGGLCAAVAAGFRKKVSLRRWKGDEYSLLAKIIIGHKKG